MRIGITGLGLIGGSMAKAMKRAGHTVLGSDIDSQLEGFALLDGSIDESLTEDNMNDCDIIVLALPPQATMEWLQANADKLDENTIVLDCCGNKRQICELGFRLSSEHRFTFVGGHPMAGSQNWGFENSSADLFDGASFVIVPQDRNDVVLLGCLNSFLKGLGFSTITSMTAEEHDETIALTSQLSHIIPSALIQCGEISRDECIASAGSFSDMTRVASLNEKMWTNLCMDNRDNLLTQIDTFLQEMNSFRSALAEGNAQELTSLFANGSHSKRTFEQLRKSAAV